ncbi:MAG: TonB-dependent receptor [Phycisphaerales bacterium]|nr:TonB-dependent receptor [Hyphomonadaceae bacterium]
MRGWAALAGMYCLCAGSAYADAPLDELRGLSIEQLANLEITSVARRPESISEAPAAIDVITADDIRRSGARNLPEVLRLARNLEVAQVDSRRYSISARGFNSIAASNKLLVLMDGRSVYTPLYAGVFWEQQRVMLGDIERIESISGPGGALWGANAVNGVINVISRDSADTQGVMAQAFVGTLDQRLEARYGGALSETAHYRVFGAAFARDPTLDSAGNEADDAWDGGHIGFRSDWGGLQDEFMLQGGLYRDNLDPAGLQSGGHLLGRWRRLLTDGSSLELQTYYSNYSRTDVFTPDSEDSLSTWDFHLQHTLAARGAHELIWGGGYRLDQSEFINDFNPGNFAEQERTLTIANVFVQDEIALRDNLSLTLGLKLEDHTFTGVEYMPNVRLAWRPSDTSLLWAAVSRAVRTPSRIDRELEFPPIIVAGGFVSETLVAYEVGYRAQPTSYFSFSANAYYHDYDNLRTASFSPGFALPVRVGNDLEGEVYGLEVWGDWALREDWRIAAGVTLLEQEFRPTSDLAFNVNATGLDPSYQVFLRSRADLTNDVTFDLDLRAIDEVSADIPAYVELGARVAWRINDRVELALAGANLLNESHRESVDGPFFEPRRSVQLSARVAY